MSEESRQDQHERMFFLLEEDYRRCLEGVRCVIASKRKYKNHVLYTQLCDRMEKILEAVIKQPDYFDWNNPEHLRNYNVRLKRDNDTWQEEYKKLAEKYNLLVLKHGEGPTIKTGWEDVLSDTSTKTK